jgi:hypothetical protein
VTKTHETNTTSGVLLSVCTFGVPHRTKAHPPMQFDATAANDGGGANVCGEAFPKLNP